MSEVKHLEINYKTDELFEAFRAFGNKDLYMVEELQGQMIDASSDSPFYGIFHGENLVARMALLKKVMLRKFISQNLTTIYYYGNWKY